MKKILLIATVFLAVAFQAYAGDYLTNTNQSIRFLRNPSRTGAIGIDGVYYNPAGVSFLKEGWLFQFNWQSPHQKRNVYSNYGPLYGANYLNPGIAEADGSFSRKFTGRVDVPIQPSLFAVYNTGDWSFQFGFGILGGGGECKFKEGIGSFEALVGQIGMQKMGAAFGGYSLNQHVEGKSFYYGVTMAAARKIGDKLSVSLGLRGIFASNHFKGGVDDITFRTIRGDIINADNNYVLDCRQSGFGISPIIGLDFRPNQYLNLALRYEFRTHLEVESKAKNNDAFNTLAAGQPVFSKYLDKAKHNADMPSMLAFGAEVSPLPYLRIDAGYNHYFDLDTKQWNTDLLKDTDELTFGVEFDVTKRIEVSAGIQQTMYHQKEDNYSDMNFNLDCTSYGFGVGVKVSDNVTLNASYFTSRYKDHTKKQTTGYSIYSRTNTVFGIGVDFSF
ncbi:MAG: hypothetical protein IK041_08280 [Bacteroidales bacterium]|nr:hypothetical protein [Bacteroidales bacterium]